MIIFDNVTNCTICNRNKKCTKIIIYKDKKSNANIEWWCKNCYNEINEEWINQQNYDKETYYSELKRENEPGYV